MRLHRVRIEGYRSIRESLELIVDPAVTIIWVPTIMASPSRLVG